MSEQTIEKRCDKVIGYLRDMIANIEWDMSRMSQMTEKEKERFSEDLASIERRVYCSGWQERSPSND